MQPLQVEMSSSILKTTMGVSKVMVKVDPPHLLLLVPLYPPINNPHKGGELGKSRTLVELLFQEKLQAGVLSMRG